MHTPTLHYMVFHPIVHLHGCIKDKETYISFCIAGSPLATTLIIIHKTSLQVINI